MFGLAILVVSCDSYADAWEPFFQNFFRYWTDYQYPLYLQTNFLRPRFNNVSIISTGKDIDWSSNLLQAIEQVPFEKVLLSSEDFWLWQPVNSADISRCLRIMDEQRVGYIRLVPKPPPDESIGMDSFLKIGKI